MKTKEEIKQALVDYAHVIDGARPGNSLAMIAATLSWVLDDDMPPNVPRDLNKMFADSLVKLRSMLDQKKAMERDKKFRI